MKKIWIVLFIIALVNLGFAGNRDKEKSNTKLVAGKVTNQYGEAVAGAQLTIAETGEVFFADFDGNFKITCKSGQLFTLTINTIGHSPLTLKSQDLGLFSNILIQEL